MRSTCCTESKSVSATQTLGLPTVVCLGVPVCGQAVECGVCDTPELWHGAVGLCARVLVPLNIHMHTYIQISGSCFVDLVLCDVVIAVPRGCLHGWVSRERSGLLANSFFFVCSLFVWCFAGALWCCVGVACVFLKTVFCECFAMCWACFANVVCRHFLSDRKMHSTFLRCTSRSVFCSFFCVVYICGVYCAVFLKH